VSLKKLGIKVPPFPRPKFVKEFFKSGITFSMFEAVTMLATRFDVILISFLGGAKEVGIYGVAYKIAQQALMLRNVNQDAFFPLFVKRLKSGNIKIRTILIPSLAMFSIVFIPTIIFYFFSKEIISTLFGANYVEAGPILFYLMIFVSFAWGTLPFTVLAQASYNEKILLNIRIYMAIANVVLDVVFYKLFGLIGIAYVSAIVWCIGSIFMCLFIYRSIYLKK
jgi:O-antigen/teichoic acid export membrane protein